MHNILKRQCFLLQKITKVTIPKAKNIRKDTVIKTTMQTTITHLPDEAEADLTEV